MPESRETLRMTFEFQAGNVESLSERHKQKIMNEVSCTKYLWGKIIRVWWMV